MALERHPGAQPRIGPLESARAAFYFSRLFPIFVECKVLPIEVRMWIAAVPGNLRGQAIKE